MPIDLGRRLITAGVVPPEEVEAALFLSIVRGIPFARALVDRGALTERGLEEELERRGGLALRNVVGVPELVARLPRAMCRRLCAIPTRLDPYTGTIDVAAADPIDPHVAVEFGFHLGAPIRIIRALLTAVEEAIRRVELGDVGSPRTRRATPAFPHGAPDSTQPPPPPPDELPIPLVRRAGAGLSDPENGEPATTRHQATAEGFEAPPLPLRQLKTLVSEKPLLPVEAAPLGSRAAASKSRLMILYDPGEQPVAISFPSAPPPPDPSPPSPRAAAEDPVDPVRARAAASASASVSAAATAPATAAVSAAAPATAAVSAAAPAPATATARDEGAIATVRLPSAPPREPAGPDAVIAHPIVPLSGAVTAVVGRIVDVPTSAPGDGPLPSEASGAARASLGERSPSSKTPSSGADIRAAETVRLPHARRAAAEPDAEPEAARASSGREPAQPGSSGPITARGFPEPARSPAEGPPPLPFGDSAPILRKLNEALARDEVVRLTLRGLRLIARRIALFVVKLDGFQGWACNAEFGEQAALREIVIPHGQPSVLATAAATPIYLGPIPPTPAHAALLEVMAHASSDVAAIAVRVGNRPAMVLLADELGDPLLGTRRMDELAKATGAALSRLLAARE